MKQKISVFGGTGFIGSQFLNQFQHDTIKINRQSKKTKSKEILYFISTNNNYNVYDDISLDVNVNLTLLMETLKEIYKENNNDFVFNFVSSWFVYGQTEPLPYNQEKTYCNPTGFYSITKRCAEQLIISFCKTFNIKYRIFRLANVLGENDLKISKKKNALQFLIKQIVNNRDVQLYNGGDAIRDYIYVNDVCSAIKYCIDIAPINQIINIGNGKPYIFLQLINLAKEYSKSTSNLITINPSKFHDIVQVKNCYLDTTKLQSYGYKNTWLIDDVIKKIIDFYIDNGIK